MILTVSTNKQAKSKKCTHWAYLLVLALAKLWLSSPPDDDEIAAGITIKLRHSEQPKPSKTTSKPYSRYPRHDRKPNSRKEAK